MALPRKLQNFNLFVDGEGYQGRVQEVTLPTLSRDMEEARLGGMNAPVDLDRGMEKLEGEFTMAERSPELLKLFGVADADGVTMRFRGAEVSDEGNGTDAVEVVMRGRFSEIDPGNSQGGEDTEMQVSYTLSYYRYTRNGEELIEIDVPGMIERIGGEDRLAEQRDALGL